MLSTSGAIASVVAYKKDYKDGYEKEDGNLSICVTHKKYPNIIKES